MSKKFVWSDKYGVGVAEIDEQHRHFFELADEALDLAVGDEVPAEAVLSSLDKLGNYASYHLSTEEEYFSKCRYAEAAWHIAAHEQFRQEVRKFLAEARQPGTDVRALADRVARFGGEWLQRHILEVDRKYIDAFHKCGLK